MATMSLREVTLTVDPNEKIRAIKALRDAFQHLGLAEAKKIIEAVQAGARLIMTLAQLQALLSYVAIEASVSYPNGTSTQRVLLAEYIRHPYAITLIGINEPTNVIDLTVGTIGGHR